MCGHPDVPRCDGWFFNLEFKPNRGLSQMDYMERRQRCKDTFKQFQADYERMNAQVSRRTKERNKLYKLEGELSAAQSILSAHIDKIKALAGSARSCGQGAIQFRRPSRSQPSSRGRKREGGRDKLPEKAEDCLDSRAVN